MSNATQALATRQQGTIIDQYQADFAAVLPSHIKPETWMRLTTSVFRRDKNLARILQQNPGSVLAALLDCARLGLEVGDTYHVVPFGSEVEGIADYTGYIELMYRAGAVASVKAECIYENDYFEYFPHMPRPNHRPDWFAEDRGKIIGAYAYAEMRNGSVSKVVVRSRAEIDKVMREAKSSSNPKSPWQKWYDRMALKTVVRELEKFVPTSAEYIREQVRAVRDVMQEGHQPAPLGVVPETGEVIDPEPVEPELIVEPVDG